LYLGDLYPKSLLYEEGEEPPAGFTPPIEQIIDYPTWAKLQAALDRSQTKRGRGATHFASSFVTCSVCEDRIIAGKTNGDPSYRCSKRHLLGRSRTTPDSKHAVSADGKRHPAMKAAWLDFMIEELLFAAIEREPDPDSAPPLIDLRTERDRINNSLRQLDERIGDTNFMLMEGRINRTQYQAWSDEIDGERDALKEELRTIAEAQPRERLPDGVTLRELWPEMTVTDRRQWLPLVFKSIILKPAHDIGGLDFASRIEVSFHDDFAPPEDEVAELLVELERILRKKATYSTNRLNPETEAHVFNLYREGKSATEISALLIEQNVPSKNGGVWDKGYIVQVLRRLCAEQEIDYVANRRDRSWVPYETRELIVALTQKLKNYSHVARELNRLGIVRVQGGAWTGRAVRGTLDVHEKYRNLGRPNAVDTNLRLGRPAHLSDEMKQIIWQMHRVEKHSLSEIGNWLKGRGIKTPTGKTTWDNSTLLFNIRKVDRARAEGLAAAA
jgi:hypothetical protein